MLNMSNKVHCSGRESGQVIQIAKVAREWENTWGLCFRLRVRMCQDQEASETAVRLCFDILVLPMESLISSLAMLSDDVNQQSTNLLDILAHVPRVLTLVLQPLEAVDPLRNLASVLVPSTAVKTLRLICKQASKDMLRAVQGLQLTVSAEPRQFKPMLHMAGLLRGSQLKRLRVHIVYPWGESITTDHRQHVRTCTPWYA